MALRFRILPDEDTRPAGRPAAGPLVAREIVLPDGLEEIRIGRHASLELQLPFVAVSARHARILRAPGGPDASAGWVVEDAGSFNGTWLDGAPLPPGERRPLAPGGELRLGNVRLRFEGHAGSPAPAAEGTSTLARRLVEDLFAGGGGAPAIRVVGGAPSASLALAAAGRAYVVGRADSCALPLPVEEVSREHAAFVRGPDGVVVRDLGSKNGVVVAGARIAGERRLSDGDLVTVGPVTLALADPASRYLRELEQKPPEPIPSAATEAPPAPPTVAAAPTEPRPASPPVRAKLGAPQLAVGVAVSVLLLLAVAAGVLVFGRG
jgi:pSer/pThr/pTyr-binding forkhead associated (FHA) protein